MKKNDLFLEEAVLDDLSSGMDMLEVPVSPRVFQALFLAVVLTVSAVAVQVLSLGWWNNDFFSRRSYLNANALTILSPERGNILDRYGKTLAKNESSFRLVLKLSDFLKTYENPDEALRSLEIATEAESGSFRFVLQNSDALRDDRIVLLPRLTVSQVLKIKELSLAGIEVEDSFVRVYDEGEIFAHLMGYAGIVSKEDLKKNPSLGNRDIIGKAGLEAMYDDELRGANGEIISRRNVKGEIIGAGGTKEPRPGLAIKTTIDKDLQSFFYKRLKSGLDNVGSRSGAGIIINPQSGEILSLISIPSFNNNKIEKNDLTDPDRPLFNRAISGLYAPGSTIKPLVAVGALNEGILKASDQIFSRGYIELPNPFNPDKPSRFVDWRPQGWVNVRSALARSSNVYFYVAGGGLPLNEANAFRGEHYPKGLGISGLKKYWEKFRLDEKTGIDIPGESKGFLPDESVKKERGDLWRIGDTYNVSIGQGDLLITPIALLNYISAIANGGKFYKPYIVRQVMDGSGNPVEEKNANLLEDISGEAGKWIEEVQKGMRDGVTKSYGTSFTLNDLFFPVAAKTGSAQTDNNKKVDAFFAGYGPAGEGQNPEIAILVLIENAREGSLNAVPVAKDVLRWYYENRMNNR